MTDVKNADEETMDLGEREEELATIELGETDMTEYEDGIGRIEAMCVWSLDL